MAFLFNLEFMKVLNVILKFANFFVGKLTRHSRIFKVVNRQNLISQ